MLRPKRSARAVLGVFGASLIAASAATVLVPSVLVSACDYVTDPSCVSTPANSVTIGASATVPGAPPSLIPGQGYGGWTRYGTVPTCTGPTSIGEALGFSGSGVAGWTDPTGVDHLIGYRGGALTGLPPLSEYEIIASYSRTAQVETVAVTPPTTSPTTKQVCSYGGWSFNGFSAVPIAIPPPTPAQVGPAAKALATQVVANLRGGTVSTAPATDALVGLPTYAWDANTNVSPSAAMVAQKTVPGSIVDGRQVTLTVVAVAQLNTVIWHWGDGLTSQSSGPDQLGVPYPQGNVSHTYYDVSVHGEHPTPYPVITAKDQIPVSATMYIGVYAYSVYVDAAGRQQKSVLGFPYTVTLAVNPAWIVVGQVESIPVCPTTTNCS